MSRPTKILSVLCLCLSLPAGALAQGEATDRLTFGDDVVVLTNERVASVVTLGGDAAIEGEVLGDVLTMGGDAVVTGHITGDLVTFGGDVQLASGSAVDGEITTMGGALNASPGATTTTSVVNVENEAPEVPLSTLDGLAGFVHAMLAGAASYLLLFLLGLFMIGLVPERFDALRVVTAREPLYASLVGTGGFLGAVLAMVVLAITLVGIPAAVALAIALSIACYVGLAAVGAVIGAILPVESLRDRPVLQLAAGIGTLYLASLVPGAGTFALLFAGAVGLGAIVRTRLGRDVPPRLGTSAGPYRSSSIPEGA